jgi:hypothetical protein
MDKTSGYILSIVGIVGVVALAVLLLNGASTGDTNLAGYAVVIGSCTDSDGGSTDYTTQGTASGTWYKTSKTSSWTDSCKDSTNLYEYYCRTDGTVYKKTISCATVGLGYGCSSGACVASSSSSSTSSTSSSTSSTSSTSSSLPDLIITGINLVTLNKTNGNMTVNFTIKNQGTGDVPSSSTSSLFRPSLQVSYLDTYGSSLSVLNYGYFRNYPQSLSSGSSITIKVISDPISSDVITAIASGSSYSFDLSLNADAGTSPSVITESDETNNGYTQTVTLTSANLVS